MKQKFRTSRRLRHALLGLVCTTLTPPLTHAMDTVRTVDSAGYVGFDTALVLDSNGFPVISYQHSSNGLKLAHCNDANCTGSNESIVTVDSHDFVGLYTSLVLDANGFPVISYFDADNNDLKLAHCNDVNCAGNNENIVTVDSVGHVGEYTSLTLDANGFPVISYWDGTNSSLKLAHCNDVNCTGNNESIVTVDNDGFVGEYTSLALDSNGFPVISYLDDTNDDLKLAHCNDANCTGNNESIVAVDSVGDVGWFPSLVLDANGFPVISYLDDTNGNLKLAHCNDANCAGNNESLMAVANAGTNGALSDLGSWASYYTALALDANGFPVISYSDYTTNDLKLAHCNDVNCAVYNESIETVDSAGIVGEYLALALDSNGFPVISYYDWTNGNLKLAHCDDANCASLPLVACTAALPTLGCTVNGVRNQPCQGGEGDDIILGTLGDDVILGGAGADTLKSNDGDDVLCGEEGDDVLVGAAGADQLLGGPGRDVLKGDAGPDTLDGGGEDDTLIGGPGVDTCLNGKRSRSCK